MSDNTRRTGKEQLQERLELDLWAFARYINPHYCYGEIHEEVFRWLSKTDACDHQLLLMPRAHLKSHCIAVWCVWQLTRDPTSSIVYLSAGEDLAAVQIYAIKEMITCDRYRTLWPLMCKKKESERAKWTAWGFNVDHPRRKEMGIRDLSIIVKTVKSNATGLHCSHLVFDDVVVPNNAYTETGRKEVKASVSQYASIKNPGAYTKAVGTRYHPIDVYHDFKEGIVQLWNDELGIFDGEDKLWDIKEYRSEDNGDMTGTYLWPRAMNPWDNKHYGFNPVVLAKVQAQYFALGENAQFWAQYYNDPNDPSSEKVNREGISYYKKEHLEFIDGKWCFKGRKLNIFAAMDVAWTINAHSDYTAIAVVGVDYEGFIYVLELDRFKTQDYTIFYDHMIGLHQEWGFRKLRVESNAGGHLVAQEMKRLLRMNGANLVVEPKPAPVNEGKKWERHNAILIPRVQNGDVLFYKGGMTAIAIEEIVLERPPHDDLKDALTTVISIAVQPSRPKFDRDNVIPVKFNRRFGGRRR